MNNIFWMLLFLASTAFGQQTICGTDEYNQQITHRQSMQQIDPDSVDLTTPYIIPVVVHIIENDSMKVPIEVLDSDVHYIIECINRDFNLENSDTSTLTDTLKQLPGNMRITFVLADTTPAGLPTTGITRTKTYIQDFGWSGNPIKFDSLGGKDAWAPRKYFNIWVGSLFPGLLGYSQFPGGPLETDGIVVTADVFKQEPINYIHYNKGRITAHEIGHSLSLRHPWGNGWACSDNMVSDIPTQNGPNYNCPDTTLSLCQGDTTRDVVKHYMDYCGDSCMVMFTKGQVYNARRSIQQYRMRQVIVDTIAENIIETTLATHDIKIYPTITNSCLKVYNTRNMDDLHVEIYATNGQRIMNYDISLINELNLDLSEFVDGMYIVHFIHKGQNIMTKKLIVAGRGSRMKEKYTLID